MPSIGYYSRRKIEAQLRTAIERFGKSLQESVSNPRCSITGPVVAMMVWPTIRNAAAGAAVYGAIAANAATKRGPSSGSTTFAIA
jgi:hypothetical protein